MKYKGNELVEITEPQIFNPPQKMVVWDKETSTPVAKLVFAISARKYFPVIADTADFRHCALIPESKPVTNRELSRWLAEGYGEVMDQDGLFTSWFYWKGKEDTPVKDTLFVRKWEDTEWVSPTREYLELGDK